MFMKTHNEPKSLVLYADDDNEDLQFVKKAFHCRETNIELKTFPGAVPLLNFILDSNANDPLPCLIILDIHMPDMSGKDALKCLRSFKRYNKVPVILFSTSTLPNDASFADEYGAALFTKPLNEQQTDIIIEKFLQHCGEGAKK
jgi:DNA-binding response OmpR family regulator